MVGGALGVVLVAGACGGGDDEGDGGGDATGSGAQADLVTTGSRFEPDTVAVAAGGDTLTIENEDGIPHTFTLDDGSLDEALGPGDTITVDVDISEDAPFHCTIHPAMTGTLTIG